MKRFDQVREHFLWLSRAGVVEESDDRLCALEVKSGGSYRTHAALDNALRAKEHSIDRVIVLAETNIEREGDILYAPIFLGGFIG